MKEFYKSADYHKCTKIDLYNVPQSSKPVINFLENDIPEQCNSFSFNLSPNLEGKEIKINKYIHSFFKRMMNVDQSLCINFCEFDPESITMFVEQGFTLLSNIRLLGNLKLLIY